MTLRHLRIFVAVCEAGGMTTTSAQMFIVQPSISLAISEMKGYYGVELFDRISRKLYLTDNGHRALQYARHLVDLFDEIEQGIRDQDAVGQLRVGTNITIGTYPFPQYINRLKQVHPSARVEALIGNSGNVEQQIPDNQIDIGVIEGISHSSYVLNESFQGDRLVFICSVEHAFTGRTLKGLAEVKDQNLILREKGSAGRKMFDGLLAAQGLAVAPLWQSTSSQVILHGVRSGLGIFILPYSLVQESLKKGEIAEFKIKGMALSREYSVIYHKNKFLSQSARALVEICKGEEFPGNSKTG